MRSKAVTSTLSISGQIGINDISALAAQGFRSIICNRPDGESAGQPSFAEIEQAARSAGLEARYVPVGMGLGQNTITAFSQALRDMPEPTLAYCRSGARSSMLWAKCRAGMR